jgi:hypothetical protein
MHVKRKIGLTVALQFAVALAAFGQGSYKAESIGAAPAAVPAVLQSALEPQGTRVTDGTGATLCEVWLRKTLPVSASPSTSSDVLYGSLPVGGFLGILHFPKDTTDFRSQSIKAGYYSLRYGLIPQDGNHMGVNSTRDAFVLVPVAADNNPDATLNFEDLVKLSRQASGTNHPGFLVGAPVNGDSFPSVSKDDAGNWNVQIKGHSSSGDLPLAFTVVGHWQG